MGFIMGVLIVSALLSVIFGKHIGALFATGVLGVAALVVTLCLLAVVVYVFGGDTSSHPASTSSSYSSYGNSSSVMPSSGATPAYGSSQTLSYSTPVQATNTQTTALGQTQPADVPAPGPSIGITSVDPRQPATTRLGLADGYGTYIVAVQPGRPGAQAGLEVNDVLTAMDGLPISDTHTLAQYEMEKGAGQPITLSAYRYIQGRIYHWYPVVTPQ